MRELNTRLINGRVRSVYMNKKEDPIRPKMCAGVNKGTFRRDFY